MIKIKFESAGHPDVFRIAGAEMDKEYCVFDAIHNLIRSHKGANGSISIDGEVIAYFKHNIDTVDLDEMDTFQKYREEIVSDVAGFKSYDNIRYELHLKKHKNNESKGHFVILDEMREEMDIFVRKYEKILGFPIESITWDMEASSSISIERNVNGNDVLNIKI